MPAPIIRKRPPLELLLKFYDVMVRGASQAKAAAALGVIPITMSKWIHKYPEFQLALEMATENRKKAEGGLAEYVLGHLSAEAQEVWKECQLLGSNKGMDYKIHELTKEHPKKILQELYIHALIHSGFDPSTALRSVGVSRLMVDKWKQDADFKKLIQEVHWHKKNFFEKALMSLVEEKHPGAVIFVNKTINADRGYTERMEINHNHNVEVNTIEIEDLDLDIETRKKILDAVRRKKEQNQLMKAAKRGEVVDVDEVKMLSAPEADNEDEEIAA